MACRREPGKLKLRLLTAVRPPKRLVSRSVRRIASLMGRSADYGVGQNPLRSVMRAIQSFHRPTTPLGAKITTRSPPRQRSGMMLQCVEPDSHG